MKQTHKDRSLFVSYLKTSPGYLQLDGDYFFITEQVLLYFIAFLYTRDSISDAMIGVHVVWAVFMNKRLVPCNIKGDYKHTLSLFLSA